MDLYSQCSLRVAKNAWRPANGGFALTVVCKATFELLPVMSPLARVQEPVVEADVYADGGSLALASDLAPFKKQPEVLIVGHAYAPSGRPVPSLVARFAVGSMSKAIQIVGDRSFDDDGWPEDPAYFTKMPLVWRRAAGGPGTVNPAGMRLGDAPKAGASGLAHAPNLLPAGVLLTSRKTPIKPAGFGPIAPMWPSRAACLHRHAASFSAGRWSERPLPSDIDPAYFNAAPPDQRRALPFGEEVIELENLHPRSSYLSTRLAPVTPIATIDYGSNPQPLPMLCDTLTIDTDRGIAMLVWRASVLLDRPDRRGGVVVALLEESEAPLAEADDDLSEITLMPDVEEPTSAALPFSRGAAPAALGAAPDDVDDAEPPTQRRSTVGSAPAAAERRVVSATLPPPLDPDGITIAPREEPSRAPALPFPSPLDPDGITIVPREEPSRAPALPFASRKPSGLPFQPAPSPRPSSPGRLDGLPFMQPQGAPPHVLAPANTDESPTMPIPASEHSLGPSSSPSAPPAIGGLAGLPFKAPAPLPVLVSAPAPASTPPFAPAPASAPPFAPAPASAPPFAPAPASAPAPWATSDSPSRKPAPPKRTIDPAILERHATVKAALWKKADPRASVEDVLQELKIAEDAYNEGEELLRELLTEEAQAGRSSLTRALRKAVKSAQKRASIEGAEEPSAPLRPRVSSSIEDPKHGGEERQEA